ncbi:MAG: type II toxin-antitoxin system prevent-host-death family antitoxin [Thermoleophilia bacterium]
MRTIGLRELGQHVHRYVRAVERGETILVTDRGRTVARLTPATGDDEGRAAPSSGPRIRPGTGGLLDLGPPLPPPAEAPALSRILAGLRGGRE